MVVVVAVVMIAIHGIIVTLLVFTCRFTDIQLLTRILFPCPAFELLN